MGSDPSRAAGKLLIFIMKGGVNFGSDSVPVVKSTLMRCALALWNYDNLLAATNKNEHHPHVLWSFVQNAEFQVHTQRGSAQLTAAALWRRNGGGGTLRELLSGQYAASTKGAAAAVQFSCWFAQQKERAVLRRLISTLYRRVLRRHFDFMDAAVRAWGLFLWLIPRIGASLFSAQQRRLKAMLRLACLIIWLPF